MTNVSEWSVTAGLNVNSPPDGWPEGMARSAVNDTAREMMGALARWYQDSNATLVTTGGTLAYNLATNSGHAALSDIPLLVFRVNLANTGAVTLNVDGLGAKPWRKGLAGQDYLSGEIIIGRAFVVAYNSGDDDFYTVGPVSRGSEFDAGTPMLFQQTAAPTGWTKQTTHTDKALRLVSGTVTTGGSNGFTGVFTSRTIAQGHLPNYALPFSLVASDHVHLVNTATSGITVNHTHGYTRYNNLLDNVTGGGGNDDLWQGTSTQQTGAVSADHAHTVFANTAGTNIGAPPVSGTILLGGSGVPMDFNVQYVDVIIATKA